MWRRSSTRPCVRRSRAWCGTRSPIAQSVDAGKGGEKKEEEEEEEEEKKEEEKRKKDAAARSEDASAKLDAKLDEFGKSLKAELGGMIEESLSKALGLGKGGKGSEGARALDDNLGVDLGAGGDDPSFIFDGIFGRRSV